MKKTYKQVPIEQAERILSDQIFWLTWRIRACVLIWWGCVMTLLLTCADQVLSWGYRVTPIFHTGDRLWLAALAAVLLWSLNWTGDSLGDLLDEAEHSLAKIYGDGDPTDTGK
jgi:hypothetical protein